MSSDPQDQGRQTDYPFGLTAEQVARRLVGARQRALALSEFPGGLLPPSMAAGYAIQDAAIALWPDRITGWKVGYIAPERRDAAGDERVIGPIFSRQLWQDRPGECLSFPVFAGGFAAVEAEYVFRLGADADPGQLQFTGPQAAALVESLHVGVETAGSPMARINEWGPTVVAADFGNNAGVILGREIEDWRNCNEAELACHCEIDGVRVGEGGAMRIPGGLLGSLAFALGRAARRGLPMRRGMLVTTGAATGIHDIIAGQRARLDFGRWGAIECLAVPARAEGAAAK